MLNYNGNEIAVIVNAGVRWYSASDICRCLSYSPQSTSNVCSRVDASDKSHLIHQGTRKLFLSARGVAVATLTSRQENAREFEVWFSAEIRKRKQTPAVTAPATPAAATPVAELTTAPAPKLSDGGIGQRLEILERAANICEKTNMKLDEVLRLINV